MMYNILESRIEFKGNQLDRITVLVENSDGRLSAYFATAKPKIGHLCLDPNANISIELLQRVACFGMETVDREEIFPLNNKVREASRKKKTMPGLDEQDKGIGAMLIEFYDTMKLLEADPECSGKQATKIIMTMNDIKNIFNNQ